MLSVILQFIHSFIPTLHHLLCDTDTMCHMSFKFEILKRYLSFFYIIQKKNKTKQKIPRMKWMIYNTNKNCEAVAYVIATAFVIPKKQNIQR